MASEAQVAGGHKATLNNPKVSDEAKQHSREAKESAKERLNQIKSILTQILEPTYLP
ncbi:hypothetical protein F5Y08DRAFT_345785 [Xylaria arbuscula]|nr:hypothetical protein F5Y08DRAFT_345785 [Xylaria arbuscula]